MAGLSGKTAWIGIAKQSAKGTPATTPAFKNAFSGGNINPVRDTDRLTETDSARDQGGLFITASGVEGSPAIYVRDDSLGIYLASVLGNVVTTGTTPNYTHTMKPGQNLPYNTFWRNVGGASGLYERFSDCFVGSLQIAADAGSPLTATAGIVGVKPERLTADPGSAVPLENDQVYSFNNAGVTLGGSVTHAIRSFELTIENNVTRQQTDNILPYDLVTAQREISLGFDLIFEDLTEYNKFHYGGAAGTQIASTIYTSSATFAFTLGTNNSVTFTLPSIAYEEFPVDPDPGGAPVVVSVRAVAQKAVGVTDLLTVVLQNQVASY